jgi:hypothetical protein
VTRQSIERALDQVVRELVRKRDLNDYSYHVGNYKTFYCFVCKRREFADVATVGHYVKRRHLITRWDLLNCHLICPACQDEGNPDNDARYASALDEYYGADTSQLLKRKANQNVRFTTSELSELLQNLRNQLKNA